MTAPDLILHNAKITTLHAQKPEVEAVAIKDGLFAADRQLRRSPRERRIEHTCRRSRRSSRDTGPDRQPHAYSRRPQLQHGASLGRRPLARRCDAHVETTGRERPRRNGCGSSAGSPSISSLKSACRRLRS